MLLTFFSVPKTARADILHTQDVYRALAIFSLNHIADFQQDNHLLVCYDSPTRGNMSHYRDFLIWAVSAIIATRLATHTDPDTLCLQ